MHRTKTDRLNWINSGLMVASATASMAAPFHLFLFAYAILGPLHYLTEISWLHDRDYFAPTASMRRLWLAIVAGATASIAFGFISSDLLGRPVAPVFEIGLVYMAFVLGAIAVFVKYVINGIALAIGGVLMLVFMAGHPLYGIVAFLLITMIHVFVFTAAFVLGGALKSNSRSGLISLGVFIACAAAALLIQTPALAPSETVRALYSDFAQLNRVLLYLFGRRGADVYGPAAAGIMRLIAFAYTYHYLNWFSKTSIIRWHEVPRVRAAGIIAAWIAGVIVYMYDYRIGFALFYVLSVLHVMLEFPLNHQTFASIGKTLRPAGAARVMERELSGAQGRN